MRAVVIGGGPAGMMAAYTAAAGGHRVTLLEQNEKLGKKLYITGKGRCNLTNACGRDEFFQAVQRNPRFLYSAWAGMDSEALMRLFEEAGLALKVERGRRVFPASDKSSDVIRTMERLLGGAGVEVRLKTRATGLIVVE
ncbi:MAG: FAD-dependent oxidoreductase, partial [Clostridia bacterium]|nr:FAD-dependent oxidoreductase [Clostridia bacterium]